MEWFKHERKYLFINKYEQRVENGTNYIFNTLTANCEYSCNNSEN